MTSRQGLKLGDQSCDGLAPAEPQLLQAEGCLKTNSWDKYSNSNCLIALIRAQTQAAGELYEHNCRHKFGLLLVIHTQYVPLTAIVLRSGGRASRGRRWFSGVAHLLLVGPAAGWRVTAGSSPLTGLLTPSGCPVAYLLHLHNPSNTKAKSKDVCIACATLA